MAHRFRESTRTTWLAKRLRFSLAAVVLGLMAVSAGLALSGNWLVSAQSNDFDADAEDIWLDPSTVYAGSISQHPCSFPESLSLQRAARGRGHVRRDNLR